MVDMIITINNEGRVRLQLTLEIVGIISPAFFIRWNYINGISSITFSIQFYVEFLRSNIITYTNRKVKIFH